jgi:phosphoribosylformimino-5-aminoimidazole carboxamide ribotide isomerase
MEVIPAIDLLSGKCVRLYQGDYDRSQVFDDRPELVAQRWAQVGATRLHVVDLDGAKAGEPINLDAIAAIIAAVKVPIQVGGGLRSSASVATLLNMGVSKAILGTVAVENPDLVRELTAQFPDRILVGIDARNGQVATRGWLETSTVAATDLGERMADLGVAGIIYTDIQRDGTLAGPNLEALREMASRVNIPIIASGGVSSLTDLLNLLGLASLGVEGAIVGRALYTGDVILEEALLAVGSGRYQDVPTDFGSSAIA